MALAKTPEERERIREPAVEVRSTEVADDQFSEVSRKLKDAPPVPFDVARQVRVFESLLQGAAPWKRRIVDNPGLDRSVPLDCRDNQLAALWLTLAHPTTVHWQQNAATFDAAPEPRAVP